MCAQIDEPHRLMLLLAIERQLGSKSKWAYYINALPDAFDSLIFWTDSQLRELQGSRLALAARLEKEEFEKTLLVYALQLRESALSGIPDTVTHDSWVTFLDLALTSERLLWARAAVLSRAFSVSIGEGTMAGAHHHFSTTNL